MMLDFLDIPPDLMPNSMDVYPAVATQDADGAYSPTYSALPAYQNIPCGAQPRQVEEIFDDQMRISRLKQYHIFVNTDLNVSPRDKLIVTDANGRTHTLYVDATRDEGGMGAFFVIRATERL